MAKTHYKSVDDYLAVQPDRNKAALARVRATIVKALPKAEEVISYQIPAYRLNGRTVIYFAGWKEHYSVYPATDNVVAELREELSGYKVTKGTIRFPFGEPVPAKLIERIALARAKETDEIAKAKKLLKPTVRSAKSAAKRGPRTVSRVR